MYGDESCDLKMQMCWFVTIDVLGGATGIEPSTGKDTPREYQVGGFHLFLV
jgi:hypothetical protein